MSAWPDYAEIGADAAIRPAPDTERTAFDDGEIRQARARTAQAVLREIEAWIAPGRGADFLAWARAHGHAYFAWTDPLDGRVYRARIVGGAGGVAMRAHSAGEGRAPWWRARMTLEGPAAPMAQGESG